MYSILFFIALALQRADLEFFFNLFNGCIVLFLGLILFAYVSHFLTSLLFEDLNFYKRAALGGIVNVILIYLLIFALLPTNERWLAIFFGICFGLFFELPRFGIIVYYDTDKPDLGFVKWSVKNYPKLLLLILAFSLILLLTNFPDISVGKTSIVIISNMSIVAFLSFIAWRLKSRTQLKRLFLVFKLYGIGFTIVLLYALAFYFLDRV